MAEKLANTEFLERYKKGILISGVILPQEVELIEKRLERLAADQRKVVAEKLEVTGGGDDWHDGAFRATDNEARVLSEQAARLGGYLRSTVVDYPDESENRATLGSRVTLRQNGSEYDVEIMGVPMLHEVADDDDTLPCSVESPIAQAVIGKAVGETGFFSVRGRDQKLELVAIDQTAMHRFLTDELAQ